MKDLVVYEGHFWMNIDDAVSKERKKELTKDLENTSKLMLVKDELWARIELPHTTKRQKKIYKADWKEEL